MVNIFIYSTWLPSFCQNTAGWGFPLVSHGNVAVRPWATIWSRGRITNCGGAGLQKNKYSMVRKIERTPRIWRFHAKAYCRVKGLGCHQCNYEKPFIQEGKGAESAWMTESVRALRTVEVSDCTCCISCLGAWKLWIMEEFFPTDLSCTGVFIIIIEVDNGFYGQP